MLSKFRNSSNLALVKPLEFHCKHFRFLIMDGVVLIAAVVARRWYRLLRGCSWGLTVSELLYSGLGGPCGSVLSALSHGETAEEMDWGKKALVRAPISCSSLSNRAFWVSALSPCCLSMASNLTSKCAILA